MTNTEVLQQFELFWNGSHGHQDRDLFRKVDWNDPRSRIEIRAAVTEALMAKRDQEKPIGRPRVRQWRLTAKQHAQYAALRTKRQVA